MFTPPGLIMRGLGKTPLALRVEEKTGFYWIKRINTNTNKQRYGNRSQEYACRLNGPVLNHRPALVWRRRPTVRRLIRDGLIMGGTYFGGEFQMFRKVIPGTDSRLTSVDHNETYGRHVLDRVSKSLPVQVCVDLGCGIGDDLLIVKGNHPEARCIGIDTGDWNREKLIGRGIESVSINIENQQLPFENETIDLIIANQVLEHTKEIFFINHEIFRTLKVGGYLYLGVPNVLSLHNRILGLIGIHPTSAKMISAHVRVFSKRDTVLFYEQVAGSFAFVEGFYGSQFYPFPKRWARHFAALLPSLAVSIFFLVRKTTRYEGAFLDWLSRYRLETNFFTGGTGSQNKDPGQ